MKKATYIKLIVETNSEKAEANMLSGDVMDITNKGERKRVACIRFENGVLHIRFNPDGPPVKSLTEIINEKMKHFQLDKILKNL